MKIKKFVLAGALLLTALATPQKAHSTATSAAAVTAAAFLMCYDDSGEHMVSNVPGPYIVPGWHGLVGARM